METAKIKERKSSKRGDFVVQRHLQKYVQKGASFGEPPQGAGSSSKPRDTEHMTKPEAGTSDLTEQGTSRGNTAEEDNKIQQLHTVKPKLSGAARRKLRKAKEEQSGTGRLKQLGHETSPQPLMGSKRSRSVGHTPTEKPPKRPKTRLEPG
jgi:hypothetical protein